MGNTMQAGALRSHANDRRDGLHGVQPKPARVRTAENSVEIAPKSRKGAELVCEAMRTVGLERKAFAADAHASEGVVSEVLNGVGTRNLPVEWLVNQTSDVFVLKFVELWLASRGLKQENRRKAIREAAIAAFQLALTLADEDTE